MGADRASLRSSRHQEVPVTAPIPTSPAVVAASGGDANFSAAGDGTSTDIAAAHFKNVERDTYGGITVMSRIASS